ncbi:hypothetical protein Efla_007486 [Eimeria flavescens]
MRAPWRAGCGALAAEPLFLLFLLLLLQAKSTDDGAVLFPAATLGAAVSAPKNPTFSSSRVLQLVSGAPRPVACRAPPPRLGSRAPAWLRLWGPSVARAAQPLEEEGPQAEGGGPKQREAPPHLLAFVGEGCTYCEVSGAACCFAAACAAAAVAGAASVEAAAVCGSEGDADCAVSAASSVSDASPGCRLLLLSLPRLPGVALLSLLPLPVFAACAFSVLPASAFPRMEEPLRLVEEQTGQKVLRLEVWRNALNYELLQRLDRGRCGGLPFFFNMQSEGFICGATTFRNLLHWAAGLPCSSQEPPPPSKEELEAAQRNTGPVARVFRRMERLRREGQQRMAQQLQDELQAAMQQPDEEPH